MHIETNITPEIPMRKYQSGISTVQPVLFKIAAGLKIPHGNFLRTVGNLQL